MGGREAMRHCPTCTCGCTCGYGGQHEPNNVMCALSEKEYWSPEAMATRLGVGTFEYKGVVGTFFHGCGFAHAPGDPCPSRRTDL